MRFMGTCAARASPTRISDGPLIIRSFIVSAPAAATATAPTILKKSLRSMISPPQIPNVPHPKPYSVPSRVSATGSLHARQRFAPRKSGFPQTGQ